MDKLIEQLAKDIQIIPMKNNTQMRGDGRLEWVCKHGIGHTVAVPTNWPRPPKNKPDYRYIHGCDGCCTIYKEAHKQVSHI